MNRGTISLNVDVDVWPDDVIDQLDDDDLLEAVAERNLQLPDSVTLHLETIIEPFLPDSVERPAKWLAADIADAIRNAGKRKAT